MKYIFSVLFFSIALYSQAQQFPDNFIGHWEGELQWYSTGKSESQKVNMQLIVSATDSSHQYNWQLIYGKKNQDNRPYVLKRIDSAKMHWVIDERNGILLDHYWIGDCFVGSFTVQNSTITNNFRREGDHMIIEFYGIGINPVSISGGKSEDVPEVRSYAVRTYQRAVLKKKKA